MKNKGRLKLGELLVNFNFVTEKQLQEAMKVQQETDKRLGQILIDLNYLKEKDLIQVLEFQLGIPHVDLSNYIINPRLADYIPENIARRHNVIPLEVRKNKLRVAMSDPTDLVAIDDLELTSGMRVESCIAAAKLIKKAINTIYSMDKGDTAEIFDSLDSYQDKQEPELDQLKEMVEDAPIVKLSNLIITQALQMRASDIHIEPQEQEVRVRYRIDGVLREEMTPPKYTQAALISRFKIIADLDITRRRIPQDGRITMNVKGVKLDMRVSTLPTVFGEKLVIRLLNKDDSLLDINKLGFSDDNYSCFKALIEQPHGILLVTGPTGSGKSTTLFAALNYLNSVTKNIVTVEDPVEYQIKGINQIQADPRTGLTFASTLRSILRQDPDIIMIGEIRDKETAQIAVRAALTGHLVLSTLHTNDAVSSITRLIDMGIPPYLVSSTLIGVVAQRLLRRLCSSCKEKKFLLEEEKEILGIEELDAAVYQARHCDKCSSTGYRGRLAVHEVLVVDDKLKKMLSKGIMEDELKKYAVSHGMTTLHQDGVIKVKQGLTSIDELMRVII
ncbi:MAG: type II secretion system protein GspE [Firmicutes bacterium]|nr:type II secretion system protein GspE [Bacillota bacterium]